MGTDVSRNILKMKAALCSNTSCNTVFGSRPYCSTKIYMFQAEPIHTPYEILLRRSQAVVFTVTVIQFRIGLYLIYMWPYRYLPRLFKQSVDTYHLCTGKRLRRMPLSYLWRQLSSSLRNEIFSWLCTSAKMHLVCFFTLKIKLFSRLDLCFVHWIYCQNRCSCLYS